ncbi:MAG: DNA polymerase III subunit beta [Candidatus Zixiibacteriota bacterium]
MNFSVPRAIILENVQNLLSVVPTRTTLPVLSNILMETNANKLRIAATDLDVSMTTTLPVKVVERGAITVPAKTFVEIIRESPEAEIEVSSSDTRVEIKIEKGSYKLSGLPKDDFPKIPEVKKDMQIKIPGKDITKMIRKTIFAASTDETRPALNGILWQTKSEWMQMVATDGHRLAKISMKNKKLKGLNEDVIIPPKVLNLLLKLVGEKDVEVGVIFSENNIIFCLDDVILFSRLIEGPYPNFDQVIPKDNDKKLIANKDLLMGTVKRVSILANTLTHQVKFSLKKGNLDLSSVNFDMGGEAKESMKCDYKAEHMDIGYNANYVLDILRQMDGEEVTFDLTSPVSAGVIHSTQKTKEAEKVSEDYLCLIMPLRLVE